MFDKKWEEAVKYFDETPLLNQVLVEKNLSNGKVLELGCGTGKFTIPIAEKALSVTAVDSSAAVLQVAQSKAAAAGLSQKINFICMDLEKGIPLKEYFTFVLAAFCLHHVILYSKVIKDSADRLTNKGTLVVLEPYPGGTMFELKRDCYEMDEEAIAQEYKYPLYLHTLEKCAFSQLEPNVVTLEWVFPTLKTAVDSIFYVAFETEGELQRNEEFIRQFLEKNLKKSPRGFVCTQDYIFIAARR